MLLGHEEHFNDLKNRVSSTIKSYFPVEGNTNILRAKDVWVDDSKSTTDIRDQRDTKLAGRTWAVPVRAELELVDKATGKVKDRQVVTVGKLPKLTQRLSYIINGQEKQVTNQFRLKSGVYTRVKDNGDTEGRWMLEKGKPFSMMFDPTKRKLTMDFSDGASVPLYPVMKALGVDDDSLERAWGKEVLNANKEDKPEVAIRKFYKTLTGTPPNTLADAHRFVVDALDKTRVHAETTKELLGKPFDKVNGPSLLAGSDKLLKVYRGDIPPDDRDRLDFKKLYDVGDLVTERLESDARRELVKKLKTNIDRPGKIISKVSPDLFGKHIEGFFTGSHGLVDRPEQFNPMGFINGFRQTTISGKHGIEDTHTLTLEQQSINPSHMGFLDPIHTPESSKIGTILQLSLGTRKAGHELEIQAFNTKTNKMEWVNSRTALKSNVAFPDQYVWKTGKPPTPISKQVKITNNQGDISLAHPDDVHYVIPSARSMFDFASNMIPFLASDQGNRTMVAAKQSEQAVSLKNREAPLVQTRSSDKTFEDILGKFSSHISPTAGTVEKVGKDAIIIRSDDGKRHEVQIYDHFPLNDTLSHINSEPVVKPGDKVKSGQLVADTNFTRNGSLALGTSLRVAYMPYKGYNFEDGIVISESAAKKLTSDHLHRNSLPLAKSSTFNKRKFVAQTAGKFTRDQIDKLDDNAVIKPGSIVNPGDVLIGELRTEKVSPEQEAMALFDKRFRDPTRPMPKTWEKDVQGIVTNVANNGKEVSVFIRAFHPADIGDKMVGRHGNKGIICAVLPDHEMPHDKEGKHTEVLLNPTGLPTRINLGQVLETAAGKIAQKTGKPYIVNNFDSENKDYLRNLQKELKQHGISDTEELFDPKTGKSYGQVLTGPQYIYKLHHTAAKGLQARSRGAYTVNMTPRGGGPTSGQTMDALGMYALLAHGATENIREIQSYKSDKNDAWWNAVQTGQPIPPPKVPFVYQKFEAYLKGMGIDVKKDGNSLFLSPLTDKGVLQMSAGELTKPDLGLYHRSGVLKAEEGGVFDPKVTGTKWPMGDLGSNWSHFKLSQRMPNPVFEKPIRRLLDISGNDVADIISYKKQLGGKSGPQAIVDALGKIDVDKELASHEVQIKTARGNNLDQLNKKIHYFRALKQAGLHPKEAYTMGLVPVLPPTMRPISVLDNGEINTDDLNQLYRGIGMTNQKIGEFDFKRMPHEEAGPLMAELYDGLKALTLTGKSHMNRHLSGIAATLTGKDKEGPKSGFFQDEVIGRRQDMSMRGTIVPEPSLSLDEVAIPRKAAIEVYKPFVTARMVRGGHTPLEALEEIRRDSPLARAALEREVYERPILLKRDPVLHKYGVQAFKPLLTDGHAIKIHPLATGGFNADFDGDKMSAYVPVSEKAKAEARKMFPSHNLFSPATGALMFVPAQESMMGLYKLTEMGAKKGARFKTAADAAKAAAEGKIGMTDVIHIDDVHSPLVKTAASTQTTVGRLLVYHALPEEMRTPDILTDPSKAINNASLKNILTHTAQNHQHHFAKTADKLKNLGNDYSTGLSFGLQDLASETSIRDREMTKAREHEKKIWADKTLNPAQRDEKLVGLYAEVTKKVSDESKALMNTKQNRMYDWVKSGARGSWDQFRQMTIAPILVADSKNRPVPVPIDKAYSEGLDIGSYWTAMHGARMGMIGRALGTSDPGTLLKSMMSASIDQTIDTDDCGTTRGITFSVDDRDALGRYTSQSVDLGTKGGKEKSIIPAGTLVTPDLVSRFRNNKIKELPVRTPLKCQHGEGICAKCYGVAENGETHSLGTNVGAIAAHSLGEPLTQLSMDCNAAGNIVTIRNGKTITTMTFEQLWESINSLVDVTEGIETKMPSDLEVWDHDKFTRVFSIQRHLPGSEMVLVKTASGHSFIVQGSHPAITYKVFRDSCKCCPPEIVKSRDIKGLYVEISSQDLNPLTDSEVLFVETTSYSGWTYDLSTESMAFTANGIRTHNSFHSGGVVGAWGQTQVGKIKRIEQLTNLPEKLRGSAILSTATGKVHDIKADPVGGWRVHVGEAEHYIPTGAKLRVGVGHEVEKGDALTEGPKNPIEMLPLTGIEPVQRYLTDEIYNLYTGKTEGKLVSNIKRRNIETFVRAMTNLAVVKDPGSHPALIRGDTVPASFARAHNKSIPEGEKPIEFEPVLKGIKVLSKDLHEDWLAQMQTTRLHDTLLDSSAEGWKSMLHGTHPVPGMAYAASFGTGTKEKPWRY